MKQDQQTTCSGSRTTSADVCRWVQTLFDLHARIAARFARPEPRLRTLAYLQGILSETERKNGWQLAEHAREARPDGMQRLLSSTVWDTDGVRDDLRSYVLEQLGQASAIVVIDETSFPKQGKHSAGVGVQYCGTTGQVENCQVGVFLSYVTAKGHTLIDRELYLPLDWCEDRDRCRSAGIPEPVRFQTKPELAQKMIERIFQAQIPISWVVAGIGLWRQSGPTSLARSAWISLRHGCGLQRTGRLPDADGTQTRRSRIGRSVRPSRWGLEASVHERGHQRPSALRLGHRPHAPSVGG